jgi:hypothetical protein
MAYWTHVNSGPWAAWNTNPASQVTIFDVNTGLDFATLRGSRKRQLHETAGVPESLVLKMNGR